MSTPPSAGVTAYADALVATERLVPTPLPLSVQELALLDDQVRLALVPNWIEPELALIVAVGDGDGGELEPAPPPLQAASEQAQTTYAKPSETRP